MSTKKSPNEKIGNVAPFGLRMLPDLKARVEESAAQNGRSLNAEIVARLEEALSGNMPDISAAGFGALIKQLEAVVDTNFHLFEEIRAEARRLGGGVSKLETKGLETALQQYMTDYKYARPEAIRLILKDWLEDRGYLQAKPRGPNEPDAQIVNPDGSVTIIEAKHHSRDERVVELIDDLTEYMQHLQSADIEVSSEDFERLLFQWAVNKGITFKNPKKIKEPENRSR